MKLIGGFVEVGSAAVGYLVIMLYVVYFKLGETKPCC
jgi:hypothetical protein